MPILQSLASPLCLNFLHDQLINKTTLERTSDGSGQNWVDVSVLLDESKLAVETFKLIFRVHLPNKSHVAVYMVIGKV